MLYLKDDFMHKFHIFISLLCMRTVLKKECLSQGFLVKTVLCLFQLDSFFLSFIMMEEAVYVLGLV